MTTSRSHPPAPLRRTVATLLSCLVLVLTGAACHEETATTVPACPESDEPAVVLSLEDEANQALNGALLRYRVDGGPWQPWPERTGEQTVIRGGPGTYELELDRTGHESVSATVVVAEEAADACRASTQTITLQMARIPCPEAPAPLLIAVSAPGAAREATVTLPQTGRQTLRCDADEGGGCRQYALPVEELGAYELILDELPGLGPMQVVDGVATYDSPPLEVRLDHRGRQETFDLSGAESATLTFPVRLDEANCALADLRTAEAVVEPDLASEESWPPLAVYYEGDLMMTDLGAAACQSEPTPTLLPFGVDLPAGTRLEDVQVLVEFGAGWQMADCAFTAGSYQCQALVPNPLIDRPFAVRVRAGGEEATGMQLPFSGLCLIFD